MLIWITSEIIHEWDLTYKVEVEKYYILDIIYYILVEITGVINQNAMEQYLLI